MSRSFPRWLALATLLVAAPFLGGCDFIESLFGGSDEESKTGPSFELRASFTGTFNPAQFDDAGALTRPCGLTANATTGGGQAFSSGERYKHEWLASWVQLPGVVTSSAWPNGREIGITLPSDFGANGGLFTLELEAEDAKKDTDSASASFQPNCTGDESFTFQGR